MSHFNETGAMWAVLDADGDLRITRGFFHTEDEARASASRVQHGAPATAVQIESDGKGHWRAKKEGATP